MQKKVSVIAASLAIAIITSTTLLYSQAQKTSREVSEVPTAVQVGVMTPQQKEHGKLYEKYKGQGPIPALLQKGNYPEGLTLTVFPGLPDVSPGGTQTDSFGQLVRKADAIVIGSVNSKSSQLTDTGTFIFTDYQFVVEDVLKGLKGDYPTQQSTITITRPGGKVLLDGQVVTFKVESFKSLLTGGRYLLFLSYIPTSRTFSPADDRGSFEIINGRVEALNDAAEAQHFEKDLTTFMSQVRLALANSKQGGQDE